MEARSPLAERGRSHETAFIRHLEAAALADRRLARETEARRRALSAVLRVQDEALLDRLMALGVRAESARALGLAPLAVVAWADGGLDVAERNVVIEAALLHDMDLGGAAHALLERWLGRPPPAELLEAWEAWMATAASGAAAVPDAARTVAIVDQARAVASASGGLLGLGRVSRREQRVLDRIEAAVGVASALSAGSPAAGADDRRTETAA